MNPLANPKLPIFDWQKVDRKTKFLGMPHILDATDSYRYDATVSTHAESFSNFCFYLPSQRNEKSGLPMLRHAPSIWAWSDGLYVVEIVMLFVKSKRMQGQADFWFHHTTRTSHILAVVRISKKNPNKWISSQTCGRCNRKHIFIWAYNRKYGKHFFYDHSWLSHQHKRVPWRMNGTDFLWLPAAIRFSFSSVFCYDFIIFRYVAEKWNIS